MFLGNCCYAKLQTYPRHIANVTGQSLQLTCMHSLTLLHSLSRAALQVEPQAEALRALACLLSFHGSDILP